MRTTSPVTKMVRVPGRWKEQLMISLTLRGWADSISMPVELILIVLAVNLTFPISPATVAFTGIL